MLVFMAWADNSQRKVKPISIQIHGMNLDAPSHLSIAYLSVIGYDQLKEDNVMRIDNISIYKKQTRSIQMYHSTQRYTINMFQTVLLLNRSI